MSKGTDLPDIKPSGKVLKILCHLYQKVESLETFANGLISSQSSADAVIRPADSASYILFLKSSLVCTPYNARSLPQSWLLQQQSQQDEVVLRVIERIRQREGRNSTNLLVIGYRLMSDDPAALIASSRTIEYRIANSNTSRLQYTPWKILLSRIGDDAMEFLLETRSVFLATVSTCYVQLTGTPMFELWPFHRYYTQHQRNPNTQQLCTSLLNDSRYKSRKRQRQHRSKLEPTPSSKGITTSNVRPCVSDGVFQESCTAVGQRENREMFIVNKDVETEIKHSHNADNAQQKYSDTAIRCCSAKKRKAEMKLDTEPEEKRIIRESVSVSNHEYTVGMVTNSESSVDDALEPTHPQRPPHKTSVIAASSQQSLTACFRDQKHRRRRKGKLFDGNRKEHRQKIIAFDHRLTIERTPMFFSRDLTEKYPPRYVLFDSDINNPLKLVADILSARVLYNNKSSSVSCCNDVESLEHCGEVKQRLLDILQLMIRNHQLCRYKYLLQHHCSFTEYSDEPAETSEKTCQKDSGSLTTKSTPKLRVPVYCRGQKPSVGGLSTTPIHVPRECAQPSKKSSVQMRVRHLLESHCVHRAVFLFVRACSLRVLPTELFGSGTNRNQFFRNVQKVVRMGRYEQLSLGCLMRSMKVKHCCWMKEIRSNTDRQQLLAKVLSWLMNAFVLPLIKSYFYVTDSATYRNRMFYYRKSLWKKVCQKVTV